jgi:hypothetical protein
MRPFLLLSLVALLPLAASAQAPVITPSGDPSVQSDTIYKLAVKAADYPDDDAVYLLDDGVVRLEADGRGTRTFRQVVQVLDEDDLESWSERSFSWAPAHEKFTLNWVKILKPDGTVVSAAPTHEQDSDIPAQMGNPVYADTKVKRISLSGLEAGMIIDISFTTEELKPFRPGDFLEQWSVSMGAPIFRSRYILELPASVTPKIQEWNVPSPRVTRTANGRTSYMWTARDIAKLKGEPFAADSNDVVARIMIGAPTTWGGVAQWYANYAKERYTASPALTAQIKTLVQGAKTLDDSIRNVQRWIARDIRYVSIALGNGGYQPRMPDTVMATKFGDCKDKTTLFVTALQQLGVKAYPVLLSSSGRVRKSLPSFHQFDHVITAVKQSKGYRFVDLTQSLWAYGETPPELGGNFGLVVFPDGKSEEITFPETKLADNTDNTLITGTIDTTGIFSGTYTERLSGSFVGVGRSMFETPLDSAQRSRMANSVARRYFEDAKGDSLISFDGKDHTAEPVFSVLISRAKAATPSGNTMILMLPPGGGGFAKPMAEQLSTAPTRKFPIDAQRIFGRQVSTMEIRFTLPDGWTAKLPTPVQATGVFGSYASDYRQEGRTLRVTRTVRGAEGIYAPARVKELADWFAAIGKDDAKFIVLERATK